MLTKSGRFRIFSIKDEPRNNPQGMFHLGPELMRGDWTFEEKERRLTIIEERRIAAGEKIIPCFYAPTFASPEEALLAAEDWEKQQSGQATSMENFLKYIDGE